MQKTGSARTSFLAMDTVVTHTAFGPHAEQAVRAAREETRRLEGLLSRFLPGSDISKLNRAAGNGSVRLKHETFEALKIGSQCAENTEGCFDMTVGPLVRLWNAAAGPPLRRDVDAARSLVGFRGLRLAQGGRTAYLVKVGQSVDLGGVGKGYAADRVAECFRKHGVSSAFTNFGGNVLALGAKPDGSPWTVGVRHPLRGGELAGVLSVMDQSVVTSGDDQRAVAGADGRRRSHIIDPRTGMPVRSGLLSVTVVADTSAVADALATALFTAGMYEGVQYLKRYPGAQAVFIDQDAAIFITGGLANRFQAARGIKTTVLRKE